jgi:hypothetical protein
MCCEQISDDLGWAEYEDGRDYFFCIKCGIENPGIEFIETDETEENGNDTL